MVPSKEIQVFISYSWTTPKHENWVLDLAERLDKFIGIHVTLDKWDLKTGNDMIAFMERMAKDRALIDKVLIILDKGYKEKANNRIKGAGLEAQIISPEVYGEVNQEKFLPVVRELDDEGKPYLPIFLRNRKYIDFSDDVMFEEKFDELLSDILDKPRYKRPGKTESIPAHLIDEQVRHFKTTQIVNGIDSLLSNRPKQLDFKLQEFLDEFNILLANYRVKVTNPTLEAIGQQTVKKLNEYTPLRDELLLLFDKIIKSGHEFDIDLLIKFLNKIYSYTNLVQDKGDTYATQFDVYYIIINELFISLIGLFLKNNSYSLIEELLYSKYDLQLGYVSRERFNYTSFYQYAESIDNYYKQFSGRNLAVSQGTLLIDRVSTLVTPAFLIEADLICYHIHELNNVHGNWFPLTYVYQNQANLDFFKQIRSKRYFDKVKGIYGVDNPQELVERLKKYKQTHPNGAGLGGGGPIPPIYRLIDIDQIATDR